MAAASGMGAAASHTAGDYRQQPLSLEPPRSVQSAGRGKETVRGPSAARP